MKNTEFSLEDIYQVFRKNLSEKQVDIPFLCMGPNKHLLDLKTFLGDGLNFRHAFKEALHEFFPDIKEWSDKPSKPKSKTSTNLS